MIRITLLVVLALLIATPAFALDLSRERVIFSVDCTDTNDVPATTVNIDVSDPNNYDSQSESIDPDRNLGDAVQTSGSSDGWCDATPWVIKGVIVAGSSEDLWIGPVSFAKAGVAVVWDFDAIGTSFSVDLTFRRPGFLNTIQAAAFTDETSPFAGYMLLGPHPVADSLATLAAVQPFMAGAEYFLRVDLNGAFTWQFAIGTYPLSNPNSR